MQRASLVSLAQTFTAYEQNLPPAEQTPYTAQIAGLLAQALPTHSGQVSGEIQRTVASEAVKRLDEQARLLVNQILYMLKATFPTQPEQAEAWGFALKQTTGQIRLPKTCLERLALLNAYLAQEESRPAAEQFSLPALATVKAVRDELQANLNARDAGKMQRQLSVIAGKNVGDELLQHLQAAAVYLLSTRYNFSVSPELQRWGFEVVSLRNGAANGHTNGNGQSPA